MNTYYLNDTPLAAFGFVPGHASGSNIALSGAWDMPARREIKANQFPVPDRWAPGGLDKHILSLRATLRAADMDDLARKARSLCWLFGQPGLRRLRYKERLYSMFATEGFQVTDIQKRSLVYAKFTVKLIEAHE